MTRRDWDDRAEGRDAFRSRALERVPRGYSPTRHLVATTGPGVLVLLLGLWAMDGVRPLELCVVPVVIALANLGEWYVHRSLLHRRSPRVPGLYDVHTRLHHRVYRTDSMAIETAREFKLVLIPGPAVLGLVAINVPLALALGVLISGNVGWLFLMTMGVYVLVYELIHLTYHLPEHSRLARVPLVVKLREHHARHHDPRLMRDWNFNVVLPLGDWLFGTVAPDELVDSARARGVNPWSGERQR